MIMTNWTGNRIVYNKDVFIFLHDIALQDTGNLKWKTCFLTEAIIILPEKQEKKMHFCTQYAGKANSFITNKGTVYDKIKPLSNILKQMYK